MGKQLVIAPHDDKILIEPIGAEKVTDGGIILPDSVVKNTKAQEGIVVAVGPGIIDKEKRIRYPIGVAIGTRVLFPQYTGHELELNKKTYRMMRECDLLATLTTKDETAEAPKPK